MLGKNIVENYTIPKIRLSFIDEVHGKKSDLTAYIERVMLHDMIVSGTTKRMKEFEKNKSTILKVIFYMISEMKKNSKLYFLSYSDFQEYLAFCSLGEYKMPLLEDRLDIPKVEDPENFDYSQRILLFDYDL